MKKILLVFLCCICINFNFAQNKKIDSLLVVLQTQKEDTIKANTYSKLCEHLAFEDLEKLSICNYKLLQLSKKNHYQKGVGLYYWHLSRKEALNNEFEKAIVAAKKSKELLYTTQDWDNYFMICCDLANYLDMINKYEEAKSVLESNLKRVIKNNRPKNLAIFYNQLSALNYHQGFNKEALVYAKKAISFQTSGHDRMYGHQNIANIYASLKNYTLAKENIDKAISFAKKPITKNKILLTKIDVLFAEEKYNEALPICLEVESFFKDLKEQSNLEYNNYNLAKCYYHLKKYKQANTYLNKCLTNKIEEKAYENLVYMLASQIYLKTNQKKEAVVFIDKAIQLLNPNDNSLYKLEFYSTKSEVEEALGNYKNALLYYKKQANIKEEENLLNNKNSINELQVDLNVTDKENNIKKLQIAQLQKTIENKKQRENLLYVSVALLLALLSTFFYVRNNRAIKNKNKIIELTNIKLENEKQLTQKSLVEKETLLKEIHHRVKNNMQLVMSLLNIQAQEANNNISDFVAVSQSRILSMSLIHENLYQTDNLSQVDFKEYVENLTNSILNAYSNVNTTITLKLEIEPVYFDIQKAIPLGLIINELVNNAYKHAFINNQKGLITLKLIRKNEKYELVVSDNGVGIQKKENAKKTLGLELVEELVFQLDGLLEIVNNKGMQYNIQF